MLWLLYFIFFTALIYTQWFVAIPFLLAGIWLFNIDFMILTCLFSGIITLVLYAGINIFLKLYE